MPFFKLLVWPPSQSSLAPCGAALSPTWSLLWLWSADESSWNPTVTVSLAQRVWMYWQNTLLKRKALRVCVCVCVLVCRCCFIPIASPSRDHFIYDIRPFWFIKLKVPSCLGTRWCVCARRCWSAACLRQWEPKCWEKTGNGMCFRTARALFTGWIHKTKSLNMFLLC